MMTDVYEMLRIKENQLARVREEIDALRVAAPLLSEDDEAQDSQISNYDAARRSIPGDVVEDPMQNAVSTEAAEVSPAIPPTRSRLRNLLGLAAGE